MNKLQIVGTSIGNLEDITIRALRTIFGADVVLAEDTRQYFKLKDLLKRSYLEILEAMDIHLEDHMQFVSSYRDQNHDRAMPAILSSLQDDKKVVYISDAGMPGISDPGFKLIRDVINSGFEVDVIPGPTAADTALLISGLPTDRFSFLGFLPRKEGKAMKLLKDYLEKENTVIIYESPFRVVKVLEMLAKNFETNLQVSACAELTKLHQNVFRGDAKEVYETLKDKDLKGEWVICLRLN